MRGILPALALGKLGEDVTCIAMHHPYGVINATGVMGRPAYVFQFLGLALTPFQTDARVAFVERV